MQHSLYKEYLCHLLASNELVMFQPLSLLPAFLGQRSLTLVSFFFLQARVFFFLRVNYGSIQEMDITSGGLMLKMCTTSLRKNQW